MAVGDIDQEWAFLVKHGWAVSGVAITKGQLLKPTPGSLSVANSWDRGGFMVAMADIASDDEDRKLRVAMDGVVEIQIIHGLPVYFGDRIAIANGGTGQNATPTYEDQYVGQAVNYEALTASGVVPVKLKGW